MAYNNDDQSDNKNLRDTSFAGGDSGNLGDLDTSSGDPDLGRQQGRQGAGFNDQSGTTGVTGSATGGFDDYGGQKQRSSFGSGGQDTTSYGDTGVSGGDYDTGPTGGGFSSGAGGDLDNTTDYGTQGGQGQQHKPGMGARVMGGLEKMPGKVTKDPQMEARGQERRTGNQF